MYFNNKLLFYIIKTHFAYTSRRFVFTRYSRTKGDFVLQCDADRL